MREWLWKLAAMLRWRRHESERREELQFHYDQEVAAGLRQGLDGQEARRRARALRIPPEAAKRPRKPPFQD